MTSTLKKKTQKNYFESGLNNTTFGVPLLFGGSPFTFGGGDLFVISFGWKRVLLNELYFFSTINFLIHVNKDWIYIEILVRVICLFTHNLLTHGLNVQSYSIKSICILLISRCLSNSKGISSIVTVSLKIFPVMFLKGRGGGGVFKWFRLFHSRFTCIDLVYSFTYHINVIFYCKKWQ